MQLLWRKPIGLSTVFLISLLIFVLAEMSIYAMGHPLICRCGYVKLWHEGVADLEVSQHLIDSYTAFHVAHGLLIYAAMWFFTRGPSLTSGVIISALFGALWEVLENTPMITNAYAKVTLVPSYAGDSLINSAGDMMATIVGFIAAARLPIWLAVLLFIAIGQLPHDRPWTVVAEFLLNY
jgi:hypothetical protein